MNIRESSDADIPAIVRLRNQVFPALTEGAFRKLEADRGKDPRIRLVASEGDRVVGFGELSRHLWLPPGLFRLQLIVDRQCRGRGTGAELFETLLDWTLVQNVGTIEATPSDQDSGSEQFLRRRGFELDAHSFESVLDLKAFEPAAFRSWATDEARIFSFAETGSTEEARRKLWVLNTETSRDEPHNDPDHVPTFEDYEKSVIEASWFDPAGQFLAEIGEEWVGISAVGSVNPGVMMNFFTGVVRSRRGRGLAKALKLRSATFAKESGATILRTGNDSRNTAMLAINRQMGYVARPCWLVMRRPAQIPGPRGK